MDNLKSATQLTDVELVSGWECTDCENEDLERTNELAAELERGNLDF
jgi:hypothetical protein